MIADKLVPISAGVQSLVFQMGPSTVRPVCNPVQSQTSQVCFTGPRSKSLGDRCSEAPMDGSGCLFLSSNLTAQPGDLQSDGPGLSQNDLNCTGLAQHALVLGPSQPVSTNSLISTSAVRSGDTAVKWASSSRPQESESACLAPRASVIQEQGFSIEVAARIEAPQRLPTRAVYKSKCVIFVKWCRSNEVDFGKVLLVWRQ